MAMLLIAAGVFISQAVAATRTPLIFTVTKTTDTYPTGTPGQLRWAIQQSNKSAGHGTINFKIPGTGPFKITPKNDLDPITKPVTINGYSQPGAHANTLATGNNAHLLIVLNGNNYKEGNATAGTGNGLLFSPGSAGSVVKGLVISTWINTGIFINGVNDISIVGNFIGTNAAGTSVAANQCGIYIQSASNTVIGTTNVADRNIIAGSFFYFNASACIEIIQGTNTKIYNNYIGTDKAGGAVLGTSLCGIDLIASNGTLIGNASTSGRNIIAGHTIFGISLQASSQCSIQDNFIGTDVSGTVALGGQNFGIMVNGGGAANSSTHNIISNNLISGNTTGIKLGFFSASGSNGNTVSSNLIGTDVTGAVALGNNYGLVLNDNSNTIGGSTSAHNVIAGNTVGGVLVYGTAHSNVISDNYIGYGSSGSNPLPNGYGVQLGLLGPGGAAGTNTIQNNRFGGGNTVTTI